MPRTKADRTIRTVLVVVIAVVLVSAGYVVLRASRCGDAQTWSFSRWACYPGPSADSAGG